MRYLIILLSILLPVMLNSHAPRPENARSVMVKPIENKDTMEGKLLKHYLVIEKENFKMYLYKGNELLKEYEVAIGKNQGDKVKVGDSRTPLGDFVIEKIEPASHWVYNFGDGKGYVNAYGKWFIRLKTGKEQTFSGKEWTGIGIHGTHEEKSIGTRSSRGCLRMHNAELEELIDFLQKLPDLHIGVYIREKIEEHESFDR